jgi:hypothetical protein
MIDAQDEWDGSARILGGMTGSEVARAVVVLKNGKRITIHPRRLSNRLRKRHTWLRAIRYFVRYYPPGSPAASIRLFSATHRLLYKGHFFEGGIEAIGVIG